MNNNTFKDHLPLNCPLCGGGSFTFLEVLWEELVAEWELTTTEEEYINYQQGYICEGCNSNLRIMTLGQQILDHFNYQQNFEMFLNTELFNKLSILEIGDAGSLRHFIDFIDGYKFTNFSKESFIEHEDQSFDLLIHSDVLEHIHDPVQALKECRRVLKQNGVLFFSIPILVDKPTRSRDGLENSYHLPNAEDDPTQLVLTEFGNDFWKLLFQAGFSNVELKSITYPCSVTIKAQKI